MKNKALILTTLISALVFASSCTASPAKETATQAPLLNPTLAPSPVPTIPLPTNPPAEPSLEALAKAEGGQLMVYTSMSEEDLDAVLASFKETYPFVTTAFYRESGEQVLTQALAETQSGQYLADVYEIDSISTNRLIQEGLLAPYITLESSAYPDDAKDQDGYWTVDRINTVVIGYNTDLVALSDIPATWEDLLDPKWKGKMAVERSDIELLGDMVAAWGQEKAYAFWEGIAAQEPAMIDGHTELAEALAAGEYAISPTLYAHRVEKLKSKGEPVEWVKTDPVFAYTQVIALAANAPHPATAKLFINWLLSESGQTLIRDLGRIPARAGISTDPPSLIEGINIFYSPPSVAEGYDEFAEKWNTLFSLK